jgi:hypothetical protein
MPTRSRASTEPEPEIRKRAVDVLQWAERGVFFSIGVLLFLAAIVLLLRSTESLWGMVTHPRENTIAYGSAFLDIILLVLMVVELAYTVVLSLRGAVLLAEPFLIVGLIAVIRRILVITVGEVNAANAAPAGSVITQSAAELAILTGVVIVFVGSIVLLRARPEPRASARIIKDLSE